MWPSNCIVNNPMHSYGRYEPPSFLSPSIKPQDNGQFEIVNSVKLRINSQSIKYNNVHIYYYLNVMACKYVLSVWFSPVWACLTENYLRVAWVKCRDYTLLHVLLYYIVCFRFLVQRARPTKQVTCILGILGRTAVPVSKCWKKKKR